MQALKALGQNFLIEESIAEEIVALAELQPSDKVWEIGPGKGILTTEIIKYNVQLRAFEIDKRLQKYLSERYGNNVLLEFTDILKADWFSYLQKDGSSLKLIANIPYQITSPLLSLLEKYSSFFSRLVLMVQREVAERLSAKPGNKHYAPLTIRLGLVYDIFSKLQVSREMFYPVPKVNSTVILMLPRANKPLISNPELFNKLLEMAFAHRRKTLANNLLPVLGAEKTAKLAELSQLNFKKRGEELAEEDFILLSDCWAAL
ncbi:MAG TPA: 16S rRNA (adenine(1518)-N(6)/adenine(1519)-N(6))-dimethyltransferase RsmA [Candidatus Cloacimonas sp.]|nr:16S rRNA (adenine(1518)-N(6)/adenine(1519)-N(6))-dimethyltransferase RsmA [Candidatus Cloacimonas sp.]